MTVKRVLTRRVVFGIWSWKFNPLVFFPGEIIFYTANKYEGSSYE